MTVAKSQVPTHNTTAEVDSQLPDIGGTVSMWTDAFSSALSGWWQNAAPALKALTVAAWLRMLATQPKTLLICAAVCFMGGFGIMLLALLATAITLLLKVCAIGFASVAVWQWVSGVAGAANRSLMNQKSIKSAKATE